MTNQYEGLKKSTVIRICFTTFLFAFAAFSARAQQTTVSPNTPELVKGSTVYAALEIENVNNLDAGQFDLSFNPNVLKVINVEDGIIEGTKVPVQWRSIDADTVGVVFNPEGVTGISGSGQLARTGFEVIGNGESNLFISSRLPGNTKTSQMDTDPGVTTATNVQKSMPGFETLFAIVGLIAVFWWVRSGRKQG